MLRPMEAHIYDYMHVVLSNGLAHFDVFSRLALGTTVPGDLLVVGVRTPGRLALPYGKQH